MVDLEKFCDIVVRCSTWTGFKAHAGLLLRGGVDFLAVGSFLWEKPKVSPTEDNF